MNSLNTFPTQWSIEHIVVTQDQVGAGQVELREENKRLKSRIRRQRQELKRLNKQTKGESEKKKKSNSSRLAEVAAIYSLKEIRVKEDILGSSCDKYGCAGKYQVTNSRDLINNTLHCSWCNKEVRREEFV